MKRIYTLLISLMLLGVSGFSQDEEKKVDRPISEPFFSGYLLDAQTTMIQDEGTIEMAIQHKFGTLENGKTDIWGIYGTANIRLALDYVVYKNLQVGYGLTKTGLNHDFNIKYTIFEQTRKNTMPVALGVYGNVALSGSPESEYGGKYQFTDRMSYFGQVIVGRKFGERMTFQLGASYTHFNFTNRANFDFDRIGLHANGRIKLTGTGSFVFNYDQPLKATQLGEREGVDLNPNIAFGWEIATVTHSFQIYMGYSKEILPQYYMVREAKEFTFEQFNVGFVITRMWN